MGLESAKLGFDLGSGYADIENAKDDHQQIREAQKLTRRAMEKEQRRIIGAQIAEFGASGIEMTGSPLTVLNQSTYELELDKAIVMENFEQIKEESRAKIKKQKMGLAIEGVSGVASAFGKPSGPMLAKPGKFGYGKNVEDWIICS